MPRRTIALTEVELHLLVDALDTAAKALELAVSVEHVHLDQKGRNASEDRRVSMQMFRGQLFRRWNAREDR